MSDWKLQICCDKMEDAIKYGTIGICDSTLYGPSGFIYSLGEIDYCPWCGRIIKFKKVEE